MAETNVLKITLKAARVNAGFTQKTAAKELGVSKDTLGNWERYESYPDVTMIPTIERIYNIKIDNIIFLPQNNT